MFHPRLPIAMLLMFSLLLALGLAACGESATPVPPTATTAPTATAAPEPTAVPTEAPTAMAEEPTEAMAAEEDPLMEYAAMMAGGPGAIYVGDINQLVGPAPMTPQANRTPTWATPTATCP